MPRAFWIKAPSEIRLFGQPVGEAGLPGCQFRNRRCLPHHGLHAEAARKLERGLPDGHGQGSRTPIDKSRRTTISLLSYSFQDVFMNSIVASILECQAAALRTEKPLIAVVPFCGMGLVAALGMASLVLDLGASFF
jgi:hypothetical protein